MFFVTALLTGSIAYFLSSIFKRGIYFLLIFFATVILNMEILSLFKAINGLNILIITFIEALFISFIWYKKGKPLVILDINSKRAEFRELRAKDKAFRLVFPCWCIFIIAAAIIILFYPPTEGDALSYHCVRALFWAHDGFINHFQFNDIRAHVMPINSEIYYTWLISLFKNDILFGSLSFFAYFLFLFSSNNLMKHFEIPYANRLWALFVFTSFPVIICQIPSMQTDLTIGALMVFSIATVFDYKKENRLNFLYFSSLAFAIALGIKTTAFMAGAPIVVWYLFILRKDFIKFISFLILNFIVFSSYNYILNYIDYGNFFANQAGFIGHRLWGGYKAFIANFIRYILNFIDFTGFKLAFYMRDNYLHFTRKLFEFIHIPYDIGVNVPRDYLPVQMIEQVASFGIMGLFFFLPSVVICFFKKKLRIFSLLFVSMLLILSVSMAYMVYSIRFIVAFACVAAPVLSILYFKENRPLKAVMVMFIMYHLAISPMKLNERPLVFLVSQFFTTNNKIDEIRADLRNVKFMFKDNFNQPWLIKNDIIANCPKNSRVAIFMDHQFMMYDIKYLEYRDNYKVDFLNPINQYRYDFSQYDCIYYQYPEMTGDVFSKKDYGKYRNCISEDGIRNEMIDINEHTKKYLCSVNENYLKKAGFKPNGEINLNAIPYTRAKVRTIKKMTRSKK